MLSDDKGYFWVLYLIYVGIVVIQVRLFATVTLMHIQPYSCVGGSSWVPVQSPLCLLCGLLPGFTRSCAVVLAHLQNMLARFT